MAHKHFKWKQFDAEIIILNVRWYLKYGLSYRNLVEMMSERGIDIVHHSGLSEVEFIKNIFI